MDTHGKTEFRKSEQLSTHYGFFFFRFTTGKCRVYLDEVDDM